MNTNDPPDQDRDHPFLQNEWLPVSSSWIDAARYDRGTQTLWIRTKQGKEYPWCEGVSPERALDFWDASSHGEWIHQNFPPRQKA